MLLFWPPTDRAAGVELVVARPMEWAGLVYELGAAFPYAELGLSLEATRPMVATGQLRLRDLVARVTRPITWGERSFVAGDHLPYLELGVPVATLQGLQANGAIVLELAAAPQGGEKQPAPKVGGKLDRGASARQRTARA